MTYTENGDEVILQMTRADYQRLIWQLGLAGGAILREVGSRSVDFRRHLDFMNRLNSGNSHFTRYELPDVAELPLNPPGGHAGDFA
jgi:hypothetical protein